jgi:hypothetical protein
MLRLRRDWETDDSGGGKRTAANLPVVYHIFPRCGQKNFSLCVEAVSREDGNLTDWRAARQTWRRFFARSRQPGPVRSHRKCVFPQ